MEGAWSCYRSGHFNEGREWSFYINRKFNRWRMVMLRRWAVLREGEWSCYRGGQFNGERMVILRKWPV